MFDRKWRLRCESLELEVSRLAQDKQALERTTSVVDAVMRLTKEHDSYELRLIDARHQIMDPQVRYQATVI